MHARDVPVYLSAFEKIPSTRRRSATFQRRAAGRLNVIGLDGGPGQVGRTRRGLPPLASESSVEVLRDRKISVRPEMTRRTRDVGRANGLAGRIGNAIVVSNREGTTVDGDDSVFPGWRLVTPVHHSFISRRLVPSAPRKLRGNVLG